MTREFRAWKPAPGVVHTEKHLEFGDFERVRRALETEPTGRFVVALDDQHGGAEVRVDWTRHRNASTAELAGREIAVELDGFGGGVWFLYENGPRLPGKGYPNRAQAEVAAEWRAGRM